MSHLFFKATGFVSGRNLPALQNVESILPNIGYSAYAHWSFKDNSASLIDMVNGRSLTVQTGATVQPTYNQNGVTISVAMGNALISDLADTADQDVTMMAVVKCSETALSILLGNLTTSSPNSGLSAFILTGKPYLTVKPTNSSSSVDGISSLAPTGNINQQQNFFVAISVNKITKKGIIYAQQAGVEMSASSSFTATYTTSPNNFALGNSSYSASTNTALKATFAEMVMYDKALTLAEIQGVALRSKERLTNRGIAF